jgi:cytochrome c-type biogenesis protein CcmH
MKVLVAALALVALAGAPSALASEEQPTRWELEQEVMCPDCNAPLAQSNGRMAQQLVHYIEGRIAAGDTKSEIKDKLVAQFGESVLAAPPKSGFNLLAWLLPLVGAGVGAAVLAVLARRWRHGKPESPEPGPSSNGRAALTPDLDRRVDEELARFDA